MALHVQGVFSGDVPNTWLEEHDLSICHLCHQLVSNTRLPFHLRKCAGGAVAALVPDSVSGDVPLNFSELSLPTIEDVCLLDQLILSFIPSKSRPAFARALSLTLRSVILENTEEAGLKLFMLPKCVLPSLRRKGQHDKPLPVDTLCNMWSDNNLVALWSLAKSRSANSNHPGGVSINIGQRSLTKLCHWAGLA